MTIYCIVSCSDVISVVSVLVATSTLVFTFLMYEIMRKDIVQGIKDISYKQQLDRSLEYAKKRLVYQRYFEKDECRDFENDKVSDEFKNAVYNTFDDILKILPDLSEKGFQDEDWYLAEWLLEVKYKCLKTPQKSEIEKLSKKISQIRKNRKEN